MTNIRKGTALLDARYPKWYQWIDLDTLDLRSARRCVLGQILRHIAGHGWGYGAMTQTLGIATSAHLHGFDIRIGEDLNAYHALTKAWTRAIKRRREKDQ